jgi:hypothetical protein
MNRRLAAWTVAVFSTLVLPLGAYGQDPAPEERVAALQQSLRRSHEALTRYEWIETTVVSLKGDEKSRKQERCYYGAEGELQKVPIGEAPKQGRKRGVRGRVAEKKKGELTEYMQQAIELVKLYVPPDPDRIRRTKESGKASIHVLEPGKRIRLDFNDYQKAGDTLGVEMDLTNNHLLGLSVSSYLDSPDDAVKLQVRFSSLADGSTYAGEVALDAPAKNVNVTVQNSGYKKIR